MDRGTGITVVYEDPGRRYVVIDKPAGLLSVPGRGAETDPAKADCAVARVRAAYPDATGPMVVHRLDMETSGLLVVALTPEAQRSLSIAFQDRLVEKRYTAVVRPAGEAGAAVLSRGEGVIDAPIRADMSDRPRQVRDMHRGKPATTRWRVMGEPAPGEGTARLELEPVTGRSHQLRVHAALDVDRGGLGAPIEGDSLYAGGVGEGHEDTSTTPAPRAAVDGRLLLHATRLVLPGGVEIESAPPF